MVRWLSILALAVVISVAVGTIVVSDSSEVDADPAFVYDEDSGTLTVSGSGTLDSLGAYTSKTLKKVVIEEGIVAIGEAVFQSKSQLESVKFPSSLETIDERAFSGCTALTSLSIPGCHVAERAFSDCIGLTTIFIGEGSTVESTAFTNCRSVTSLEYRGSSYSDAFLADEGFGNGCTVTISGNVLPSIFGNASKVKAVIINGPTNMPANVFAETTNIKTMTISSVTGSITASSMAGLGSLTVLTINKGTIADNALSVCKAVDTLTIGQGVTLSSNSLAGMSSVSTVKYSSASNVTSPFEADGFGSEDGVDVTINGNAIVDKLFYETTSVSEITISSAVKSIGKDAFYRCSGVTKINYDASSITSFSSPPFAGMNSYNCNFVIGVSKVPTNLLNGANLGKVTAKSGITSIGDYAFYGTSADIDITSIIRIGSQVDVGKYAFASSTISSVPLNNIKSVGDHAFMDCKYITKLDIERTVSTIGSYAFSGCDRLVTVNYNSTSLKTAYDAFDNAGAPNSTVIIGDNVTKLITGIFDGFNGRVLLNSSVKYIEDFALANTALEGDGMELLDSLEAVGASAFAGSRVPVIFIPESLASLSPDAFDGTTGVMEIKVFNRNMSMLVKNSSSIFTKLHGSDVALRFGPGITNIPTNAFKDASVIESVDLTSVEYIGSNAFRGLSLTQVTLGSALATIGSGAFADMPTLSTIIFLNPNTEILSDAFQVNVEHLDTDIYCLRHSTAADYPWGSDNRDKHMHYDHVEGEYSGMMEVFFVFGSSILGESITNSIIDFFIDNVSLRVLESVDMGSLNNNNLLLLAITALLFALLFLFIYNDHGEGVRIIEIILALAFTFVITECVIRRIMEYPDWYWPIVFWVATGFIMPIYGAKKSYGKRKIKEGETLLRLYSAEFEDALVGALYPLRELILNITHGKWSKRIIVMVVILPLGWAHCLIYAAALLLCHVPAYIFSVILCKIFSVRGESNRKHVKFSICPECGVDNPKVWYRCDCGWIHKDLTPGKYGVHKATCGNPECDAKFVCGYTKKRWNDPGLHAVCCSCGRDMAVYEADPYSVSIVGTPGSGKTTMAAGALKFFTGNPDMTHFETSTEAENVISQFEGDAIQPTNGRPETPYYHFYMDRGSKDFSCFYIYDISGRSISDLEESDVYQAQYRFQDGIIITISPHDIPDFERSQYGVVSTSGNINDLIGGFLTPFRKSANIKPNEKSSTPLAIVLTHASDAGLLGAEEQDIRDFICSNGQMGFINAMESCFSNIRYFTYDTRPNSSGEPEFVPFRWIINCVKK